VAKQDEGWYCALPWQSNAKITINATLLLMRPKKDEKEKPKCI